MSEDGSISENDVESNKDVRDMTERIENMTTRNFSITRCPEKVWKDFVKFCEEETGDSYSMGIKVLLDLYKTNAKELMLYKRIIDIEDKVDALTKVPGDAKLKTKTFGSGLIKMRGKEEKKDVKTK